MTRDIKLSQYYPVLIGVSRGFVTIRDFKELLESLVFVEFYG